MIKLKPYERVFAAEGRATPEETRWLDRLAKVRPDIGRCRVHDWDTQGRFHFLYKTLRRRSGGTAFGCYPANLAWVRREVLRGEAAARRRDAREVRNHLGAYI